MNKKPDQFGYHKLRELSQGCRINGLPVTPQRQAVLEALAGRNDHPSADELFDEVKKQLKGISRTTVYRVLETLVRIGVVQKIGTEQARARFDADTRRHHHILCMGCGKLSDLVGVNIAELMPERPDVDGFRLFNYSVQFTGLCSECLTGSDAPQPPARPVSTKINKEEK
ncbi:Fur family transcriptional regulator [Trichloromonas sp.]|uniref:Fur family transcriptional regulator n=1 Tax=Trichloromonas sp. TaxID=3069249 RepID=UPI003D816944